MRRLDSFRRPKPRASGEVRLELTPLIDVVFLLLTFFVLSPILLVTPTLLELDLPTLEGTTTAAAQPARLTLTISPTGDLALDELAIDRAALVTRLAALAAQDPQPRLVIAAAYASPAGLAFELLDAAQRAGLTNVAVIGLPPAATSADAPAGPATTPAGP